MGNPPTHTYHCVGLKSKSRSDIEFDIFGWFPDICINATIRMPAQLPPKNAASNHQIEII